MPTAQRIRMWGGRPHPIRPRPRAVLGAVAAVGLLAFAGCGGADDGGSDTADKSTSEQAGRALNGGGAGADRSVSQQVQDQMTASTAPAPADAKSAEQGATAAVAALQPIDIGRSIIFTATMTLEVDNVAAASDQAMTAVAAVGGFLYGQQGSSQGTPTNVLTFKVAPKDFQDTLRRLGGLGRLAEQNVTSDDVTEKLIDLESRIRAAEVSVERLRSFVAAAGDVTSLAALERELLQRETDLETLRGQQRGLEVQVDLATITLTLTQLAPDGPAVELTVTAYAGEDEDGAASCPGDDLLRITEGGEMTVCYEIRNTGNLRLTELRLDDPGLKLARDEITVIDGDLNLLDPDQSVILAATVSAERDRSSSPRLRAVAVDAAGEAVRTQVTTTAAAPELNVEEDTSVPGFITSFTTGWGALVAFLQVLLMLAGALLPFAWLPVGIYVVVRWLRSRKARRGTIGPVGPPPGSPPPSSRPPFDPASPGPAGPSAGPPPAIPPESGSAPSGPAGPSPRTDPDPAEPEPAGVGGSGAG
ncbi:MAG: DUF4349 domain-containing protein [Acidimicrobiales bacterium]